MLGTFLEIGIETDDIASAFEEFRALGFSAVPVGDIRSGAYAVVSDGTVCVGLHERALEGPSLTFVRPDVKTYVRALRRLDVELEFAKLGDQEFHEIGFRDPNGQLVTLVEARTFSPPIGAAPAPSLCGQFLEFSLATSSLDQSRAFWEALGFAAQAEGAEPRPWLRLAGPGISLGLYESALFQPGASFTAGQLGARMEYLRAKGHNARPGAPMAVTERHSATLTTAATLPIYLLEEPAAAN